MARWASLLAAGLVAAPVELPGAMPRIDAALVVEAAQTCRGAPLDFAAARDHARLQGFGDLPADVRGRVPYTTLTRRDVRLILIPTTMIAGSCKVYGETGDIDFADVVAQLASAFGGAPITSEVNRAGWWFDDRTIHASLDAGTLWINVMFHQVARADMTAGPRPPRPAPTADPRPQVAMRPTSPADEIAAAAAACVAALGNKGIDSTVMGRLGWPLADTMGEARIHSRVGSNLRIVTTTLGTGRCIVDAYGERMDGFDAIRDAIRARLTAQFGSRATLGAATGAEPDFSRGQGFRIGKRIGVLSSERRDDGLSIRFTVMSIR
ncbi:MAG TPA: hypothetical protein VEA61_05730 [Allosphingosinicella sp.]|nr:hypothetical protein [Allosphingosinicella sp.]